tara:strand:+ start:120 stop:251 length:132 start_codon:yes stop_codon:yes gene_type:complete
MANKKNKKKKGTVVDKKVQRLKENNSFAVTLRSHLSSVNKALE